MIKTKLALAITTASLSAHSLAVDLGEFNGTNFSVGGYLKAETGFRPTRRWRKLCRGERSTITL